MERNQGLDISDILLSGLELGLESALGSSRDTRTQGSCAAGFL